jgi:regulator of sirC expression with transglutaminase-like and TPR domain
VKYTAPAELIDAFAAFVGPDRDEENIDLIRAALVIARAEYPGLDIDAYTARVDELAQRIVAIAPDLHAQRTIGALNHVLFVEEGLRGNRDDYYDPRNSFLNDVLDRSLGIPITLSIVYMEVARRIGFPLAGVGLPGHFLLKHYASPGQEMLIDCFNRGDILSQQDCQRRLDDIYAGEISLLPEFLHPVSRRQILTRVLNNLKTVYLSTRDFRKALTIADLMLVIHPRSPEDVKQRALLRYSLALHKLAGEDLEEYLKMSPDASDAEEIRQMSLSIRRSQALMN